ncbi:MAG: hypothetical protein L3J98_08685 [Gammaproteobacteria bacterium]|nr:hypothetical protein [Gammaproteobacteria bacterium]
MSINSQQLLELLPAIHRIRDAEIAEQNGWENGPLEDLVAVIAEQMALMEENIEQSYDDLFIETCADWLTPYIGDVIGYQSLHGKVPDVASPRAEVAHTIALRRRKGTAVVLEQLARDVTGWNARAVEFFKELGWTQHMNHHRDDVHYSPDMRNMEPLARIGSAFNRVQHTVDVRRVESSRGQFNIPSIGIFLWRLEAYEHTKSPALRLAERRYLVSPLGHALPLYSRPLSTRQGLISQLASPENVPEPLARRQLHDHLDRYYGQRATAASEIDNDEPSIVLHVDSTEIPREQIRICNLSDDGPAWAHEAAENTYAIDPVLGRIALPPEAADPANVLVSYHRGFSADMGGGEYERENSFALQDGATVIPVPTLTHPTLQAALDALGGAGVVEITDNGRYEETLTVSVADNAGIELRAANLRNPHLALTGPLTVNGGEGSRFSINGCLLSGDLLTVPDTGTNNLSQLEIVHCTWVPGRTLDADGNPLTPAAVSISVALANVSVSIERAITGALRMVPESRLALFDSIVDATDAEAVAFADLDDNSPGATLSATASTVIGKIHAREFDTVSNCILLARLSAADTWNAPVWTERKQTGCVRFSFLPFNAIVPRRYRCQPDSADSARRLSPRFTSLNFGQAAYGQLSQLTAEAIWRGADDESEMGAFHHLYAPQRDRNLRIRLREYLRVGLEAGLFYET